MNGNTDTCVANGDIKHMNDLLVDMLNPNAVHKASQQLKTALANPASFPLLLSHIINNQNDEVRQIAAVLLRRRILKQWPHLSTEVKTQAKQSLLARLGDEQTHSVRIAVAHVVSAVGRVEVETWGQELCEFLFRRSQEEKAEHREVAIVVLTTLIDGTGESLSKHFPAFAQVLVRGLVDASSSAVRLASLRGVQTLALSADSNSTMELLRPLMQPVTQLVEVSLNEDFEDIAQLGMEILDDLMERTKVFKAEDIPYMVSFVLKIAAKPGLDCGIREQALNFIHWVAKNKPKTLYKDGLVAKVLDVVIPLGTIKEPEDIDDEETTEHRIASQCLDSLALNLPNKYVYGPVLTRLQPYVKSNNPLEKKAALVFFGVMAEGCENVMKTRLHELLPFVFASLQDQNTEVQAAAATCFGHLAEYLQPEIFAYHEEAMRQLLAMMDGQSSKILEKVCMALEVFCEELGAEEIKAYLPTLLPKLLATLKSSSSTEVRENCMGAIGAAAAAAEMEFSTYSMECLTLLRDILAHDGASEDVTAAKAKAAECVGAIAVAIENEFEQHMDGFMNLVFKNVDTLDSHQVRRSAFLFFSSTAQCSKDGYVNYLEKTMVYVFASMLSNDGVEKPTNGSLGESAADSDDEDDDLNVRTGYLDELETAVGCLETLWEVCPLHCMKYLKKTTEALDILHIHFSSDVRELCASLMAAVLKAVHQQFPTDTVEEFIPGLPVTKPFLCDHVTKLWEEMFWFHFSSLLEDADKEQVTGVATVLGELIEALGPQLVEKHVKEIVTFISTILGNEHECQKYTEVDEDEESRLEEEQLFEAVSVLIGGMSKALGGQFAEIYSTIHPRILSLSTHKQSSAYRCIGLGCAAAAFHSMGSSATPFVQSLIQPVLNGVNEKDDLDLKRNASYAAGVLVEVVPSLCTTGETVQFLKAFHPVFLYNRDEINTKEHLVLDNAIAALARFMMASSPSQIPLEELLPVFLSQLPLREDDEECDTVMKGLIYLFGIPEAQQFIETHIVKFLTLTIEEANDDKTSVTSTTKSKLDEVNNAILRRLGANSPTLTELDAALQKKKARDYVKSVFQSG
eukprot:GHVQ01012772.1.p1 GENE.GHVQ01012772.1~~GHVQ01012772.1.p1  ORF type:complete len:1081 (-),score=182.94 GHVQ01012772.1:633-3875(-)